MKMLKVAVVVAAVVVVGIAVFVATFDIGRYKGLIQDRAKAATGRDVTIGAIKLAASLTPAFTLTDVRIANAPWGTRADMLRAKRVEVHLDLVPLLHSRIDVRSITADSPDLWLETDAQGRGNWAFGAAAAPTQDNQPAQPAADSSAPGLAIGSVAVKDLALSYKDGKREASLEAKSATVSLRGSLAELAVTKIDLAGATIRAKTDQASAEVSIGKAVTEAQGKIAELDVTRLTLDDAKVAYKSGAQSRDVVIDRLALAHDGAIDVTGTLDGQDIRIKGQLAPVRRLIALDQPIPAKLSVEALGLKADTDLTVDMTHARVALVGSLSIPSLVLTRQPRAVAATSGLVLPAAPAPQHLFSDAALPWDDLNTLDATVNLALGRATLPDGLELANVVLPIALAQGKLAIAGFSIGIGGGTMAGTLTANAADKTLAVKADGKGMSAETLARQLKKGDVITHGPLDLQVDVRAGGTSVRAMMASLDGRVLLGVGEAKIKTSALNAIGADLLSELGGLFNTKAAKPGYTAARCAVANFRLAKGVASTSNGVAVVTDKMQLTASGKIDLGAERIDLAIVPKATGGLGIGLGSITQAIKLSGPLAAPGIALDRAGTVKGLGALGVAFATGGASVLAEGVKNRIDQSGANDPCQVARSWTGKP